MPQQDGSPATDRHRQPHRRPRPDRPSSCRVVPRRRLGGQSRGKRQRGRPPATRRSRQSSHPALDTESARSSARHAVFERCCPRRRPLGDPLPRAEELRRDGARRAPSDRARARRREAPWRLGRSQCLALRISAKPPPPSRRRLLGKPEVGQRLGVRTDREPEALVARGAALSRARRRPDVPVARPAGRPKARRPLHRSRGRGRQEGAASGSRRGRRSAAGRARGPREEPRRTSRVPRDSKQTSFRCCARRGGWCF